MELLNVSEKICFSTDLKPKMLIRARHKTWKEARNGLIAQVRADSLLVLFLSDAYQNAAYFLIKASEVSAGQWDIKLTLDFQEILTAQIEAE